jgi:serine/threonine protein phosphatase PrpC
MPYVIVSGCALIALLILRLAVLGQLTPQPELEVASAQIIGRREINADVFEWSARQGKTLLVLADGIGAGTKGRTAALAATDSIVRTFDLQGLLANPAFFFKQAFGNANEAVLRYVPDGTAGASVISALISEGKLFYALAGNCMAAVFRGSALIQVSEGQTLDVLAKEAYRRKEINREEALKVSGARRVYNYVGKDNFSDMELFDIPVALKEGDYIMLMSDGVYEFCPKLDIEGVLRSRGSCEQKAQSIMDLLSGRNDPQQDNASVVLVRVNKTD